MALFIIKVVNFISKPEIKTDNDVEAKVNRQPSPPSRRHTDDYDRIRQRCDDLEQEVIFKNFSKKFKIIF